MIKAPLKILYVEAFRLSVCKKEGTRLYVGVGIRFITSLSPTSTRNLLELLFAVYTIGFV